MWGSSGKPDFIDIFQNKYQQNPKGVVVLLAGYGRCHHGLRGNPGSQIYRDIIEIAIR